MVLGQVTGPPVCFYCNKPGHVRSNCFKYLNDLTNGRVAGRGRSGYGSDRGRGFGGRSAGR